MMMMVSLIEAHDDPVGTLLKLQARGPTRTDEDTRYSTRTPFALMIEIDGLRFDQVNCRTAPMMLEV